MRRVLCIIEGLGSGGAERQLVGLASLLKNRGHDVTVLTYYPDDFYKHVLDESSVAYEYCSKAQKRITRILVLRKRIKELKPDVVISYMDTESIVACVIKMSGIKYNLIVSERNTSQNNNWKEWVKFFLYRRATWIVPNSYTQADFIAKYYPVLIPKVKTITNFVDTDFFKPKGEKEDDGGEKILCVGRLTAQKNVLKFLEAIKILKSEGVSFQIDWVGNKRTEYAKRCFAAVVEYGIQDVIHFTGETKDVLSEYRNHTVLCLPSIYEGFPNVVCEAMSCGLPIICSNVCDNQRIVTNGENGILFDPNDERLIADALKRFILLSKEEKKKMGLSNRIRALDLFSKEIFVKKYEILF